VDAAVSHRPDTALLAVTGQEDSADFDTVCAGVAEVEAVGIGAAGIGCGGVLGVEMGHGRLPRI
jgi:hypothetical protein